MYYNEKHDVEINDNDDDDDVNDSDNADQYACDSL